MELTLYAPSDVLIENLEVLDRLQSEYTLRAVILRSPDPEAFSAVRERGLEAWWLAPGLWGNTDVPEGRRAKFLEVSGWTGSVPEAFEARWPMLCPTDPELPVELGIAYARTATELGATGVYCTHLRYHHPADVAHLWGCVCSRCASGAESFCGISTEDLSDFLRGLAVALRSRRVHSWRELFRPDGEALHPLVGWWAYLTDSDVPVRWFEWKNATLSALLSGLAKSFRAEFPGGFFASNSFEPLWAPLVGHDAGVLRASEWYSPLLGYWDIHVTQSASNLATWHTRMAQERDISRVLAVLLECVLKTDRAMSEPGRVLSRELLLGSSLASRLESPYHPVLNGTSAYHVPLSRSMEEAREAGAAGVVLQGVSQLIGDPRLDNWY